MQQSLAIAKDSYYLVHSKAYPGLRHLEVLQGVSQHGGNVTLGSICAPNTQLRVSRHRDHRLRGIVITRFAAS
jgi:hypothetical protein